MIRILIVDDSKTETEILKHIFKSQSDMHVIGHAINGKEAIELAEKLKPDLITMDIHMPIMDGLEATRIIMSSHPVPIVIISSQINSKDINTSFLALEAGALCVLEKPKNINAPHSAYTIKYIIDTIRSMAQIKVIKKRFFTHRPSERKPVSIESPTPNNQHYELIAIGTSVGGPQALKVILSDLPTDFPLPIVVVQHMSHGFISGFTKWLNANSPLNVKDAVQDEELKSGFVYFAPDSFHLEVKRKNKKLYIHLAQGHPVSGFCPSATVLFHSVAKTCGANSIGILLTGMGNDGAQGLLELKKQNAHTLIQDQKSAIVFGMAGVAQSLGAVDKVIELEQFSAYLKKITQKSQ